MFTFKNKNSECIKGLLTGSLGNIGNPTFAQSQLTTHMILMHGVRGWIEFVEEVAENDERKMNLLQEIAGYVLFSELFPPKMFFPFPL